MEWDYFFNTDTELLEVMVKGELSTSELNAMAQDNLEEIRKHDCFRCLLNYTGSTKDLSVVEMFHRPKEVAKIGVTAKYRIALLVRSEQYDNYKFVENVYKNNGYDFEIFIEKESAVDFLMKRWKSDQ
jgi:hypothetical protein